MTTFDLYRKHKKGEISREKFLYEVRRDNNLPWITNLTSYDDAVSILKHRGIVTDETPVVVDTPAIGLMTEGKEKKKEVTIDTVNPYEYRHGLQHELTELDDYSDEALEKAKANVLKNLAKDANFYSNLLNAKQSPFTFKASETDAKGMQANADGTLKKGAGKLEKANVKDNLGKKEAGKKKPKGVKVMPDKGVTGSEKTIKEGLENTSIELYQGTVLTGPKEKEAEAKKLANEIEKAMKSAFNSAKGAGSESAAMDERDDTVYEFEDELSKLGFKIGEEIDEYIDNPSSSPEDEFNQLMSKYDWYYEMSDDPRTYDRGLELDKKLKVLGKQIGVDKAVAMFNAEAPSDRKVTSTFFAEGEDKHAKLKETLKAALKKEDIFKKSSTAGGKEDLVVASSPKSKAELTKRGYVRMPGTEDATGLK